MHSGSARQLGHRPALDGLRGVAILLVMVSHALPVESRLRVLGTIGVTVFFTLSGFLITGGLIGERAQSGRLSLRGFWARRIRRLVPALIVFLVGVLVVSRFVDGLASVPAIGFALVDLANWAKIFGWADMGQIAPTWSLSIEEQFYVVWPLVLVLAFRSTRWRAWVYAIAVAAVAYAAVARVVLWDHHGEGYQRIYFGTDTRMDALLVGCAVAAWCSTRARAAKPTHADLTLVTLAAFIYGTSTTLFDNFVMPVYLPLALGLVLWWSTGDGYRGILSSRLLRWAGQRSYAFYLWHLPALYVAERALPGAPHLVTVGLGLAGAWVISELSWRFVEQPFLRRRSGHAEEVEVRGEVSGAELADSEAHHTRGESGVERGVGVDPVPAIP